MWSISAEEAFFFAGKPEERQLYEQLAKTMHAELPPYQLRVQKTQITLVNPKVFACVSLKWKNCIVVSFGLPDRMISPRIHQAVRVRENRWTHHMKLYRANDVDEELMDWLKAAYWFSSR